MFFSNTHTVGSINLGLKGKIDGYIGLEIIEIDDEERALIGEFTVSDRSIQPYGLLHGGVSCLIAESMGSLAGAMCCGEENIVVGQSLTANHIRSAFPGDKLSVKASNIHLGRKSQVWNIELKKTSGKLIAQVVLTLSVLPRPS